MRLDKFIGQATDFSRREIHILIKRGAVQVNGETVSKAALQLQVQDLVTLDDEPILQPQTRYLMLHKPAGYVCANSDSEHPTVLDLIDLPNKGSLQVVGRLDIDTTGLVLLTDDGQWNHRITAPKSECAKTYLVTTADPIDARTQTLFAEGILLHGEPKATRPAQLELLDTHCARITIHEGKYHQVKRMFAAAGNRVVTLHRESIGHIQLDPTLEQSQYRTLTPAEIASVGHE
jgi:16S rRNA pseudouridine516 synthase